MGTGGAGFSTHVKLALAAEYIVINGAECELLLWVDQQLMAVEAEKLVRGLEAMMTATGAAAITAGLLVNQTVIPSPSRQLAQQIIWNIQEEVKK